MDIDRLADQHLKPYGLSLPENDELRMVAEMVKAEVKEAVADRLAVLGTNKVPTPLGAADMQAIADVMSRAAEDAVAKHMAEITQKLDVLASQVAFITNMVCQQAPSAKPARPKSMWRRMLGA